MGRKRRSKSIFLNFILIAGILCLSILPLCVSGEPKPVPEPEPGQNPDAETVDTKSVNSEFKKNPGVVKAKPAAAETESVLRRRGGVDIREDVLDQYDPRVSPTRTPGYPTVVQMSMVVNHFSLDELESIFYVNCWLRLEWTDKRLKWAGPTPPNVRFTDTEIWKPDITVYNNANPTDTSPYGSTLLVANYEGKVTWIFPARLSSICRLNMVRWPHDFHTCTIKMGSWSHDGFDVDLELKSTSTEFQDIKFENWVENSEWRIIESNATRNEIVYDCCPEPFVDVEFSFKIQRNSPSYAVCVILPIFLIALINVLVFLLPPTSGQKITLGSLNFFIICIFLIYLESRLPSFSDHIPLVVILYACNLVLVGISLTISVVVLNLSTTRRPFPPPHCIRRIFCNSNFVQILGLGHLLSWGGGRGSLPKNESGDDLLGLGLIKPQTNYLCNSEWILMASVIDRISFIVYLTLSGIILGVCLA